MFCVPHLRQANEYNAEGLSDAIVPHIINALDFASTYLLNKLKGYETVDLNTGFITCSSVPQGTE